MRWALLALALAACSTESPLIPAASYRDRSVPIASTLRFDAGNFAGTWYEIASYPVPFQRGCTDTRATYGPLPDGRLSVLNACRRDGAWETIAGTARVVGPGRLEVRLDGVPLVAPYWVLWVDEDHRTAVVGVPSGRAGWVLNREPQIPDDRLEAALEVLEFNGYDLSRLARTPQGGAE